jgi:hypothetical protein
MGRPFLFPKRESAMVKLRAVKNLSYNTRRLLAGEEFEANDRDAKILIGIKKARAVRQPAAVPPPPPAVAAKIAAAVAPPAPPSDQGEKINASTDDLAAARAAYREAFGKAPFHTWDAATLREKIAAKT